MACTNSSYYSNNNIRFGRDQTNNPIARNSYCFLVAIDNWLLGLQPLIRPIEGNVELQIELSHLFIYNQGIYRKTRYNNNLIFFLLLTVLVYRVLDNCLVIYIYLIQNFVKVIELYTSIIQYINITFYQRVTTIIIKLALFIQILQVLASIKLLFNLYQTQKGVYQSYLVL